MTESSPMAVPPDRDGSNVTRLGWVAFWSGMSQEMIYPLLPVFVVVALHASKAVLGLVEGLLVVGVTVARLATARWLDGGASPRRLTRGAYVLSLVARPLMALAPTVAAVGALRTVDGLGKGGKDAPRDTLVAADAQEASMGRSFGIQRMLDTLGSVAGPAVAGALLFVVGTGARGLRIVFALCAIPAACALWSLTRVHDAPHGRHPTVGGAPARSRFPRAFWVLIAATTVFGLANSSDTLLLLRAKSTGLSTSDLAFAYALFNLAYAGLALPAGTLSDRIGRRPLLLVAWTVYALVYAGFAYADAGWQLWFLFAFYGLYYATAEGTIKAWVAGLVPPDRRGAAYGVYAAASGLLVLPASVLAGALWDAYGPRPAFLLGAGLAVVALIILAAAPSGRTRLPGADPVPDDRSATGS